ncbi:MAG: hypothetical protein ABR500_12215 [Dermatophilaceae bacterium]|nr:hypothetical protein [Intrasporangiaceae bacterium]
MDSAPSPAPPRASSWALVGALAFWGVGAVGGGIGLAGSPDGSALGIDPDVLEGTAFPDFRIPGLLLLALGVAALAAAAGVARATRRHLLTRPLAWFVLLVAVGINAWIFGEMAVLWGAVAELPAEDQRFYYGFWVTYGLFSLVIGALAVRVTRTRLAKG